MKKLWRWLNDNFLGLATLFLLAFIPLYPKLPLVDIRNTWVYVRVEDFIVLFVLCYWGLLLVRKKIDLKTPLTVPMLAFWLIGGIATIHGLLLIFPTLAYVYPNVAFFSFVRRIEYMSVFFIAYQAVKDSRIVSYVLAVLSVTVLAVSLYGIGQKYFGFYAFLTMNEEFAKGIPIQLSLLSRVSSTFGGHYDLAAYLVLMLPILISMIFAFRHWFIRVFLFVTSAVGFIVLLMTVSRISIFALLIALGIVFLFQKKKMVLVSAPIVALVALVLISISPTIFARFGNTIKEIDVLVDAKTGEPLGHTKEVPNSYFANKVVKQQFSKSMSNLSAYASPSAVFIFPYTALPEKVDLIVEPNAPSGEDLPSGTGYINLALSPVEKKLGNFYYEPKPSAATTSAEVFTINGDYLLKKVLAYDLSFTTRFQGEWPHALAAFKRNVLVGSGYGSVGLAVDNSYLRMLGEVGLLGFGSFLFIFIIIGVYIRNALPSVDSPKAKSFIIGFIAGAIGLAINALFIDVFEASKIAFSLWLLIGLVFGILRLRQRTTIDLLHAYKRVLTSTGAIIVYILVLTILLYSSTTKNYFVGDDFTWLRWAAECGNKTMTVGRCQPTLSTIFHYFIQSDGFFYRPGAKTYYLLMYWLFWLNQSVYHLVSLALHFFVAVLVYLLAKKMLKNLLLSSFAGLLFLLLSGTSEAIYWVSATGFLFTASFSLLSLLSFIAWEEKKKRVYFIATLGFFMLSLSFHELGLVTPLFYLLYRFTQGSPLRLARILFVPIPLYLFIRYVAHSHWLSGDYSYNILKIPFNAVGNSIGYFLYVLLGPISTPLYLMGRSVLRSHVMVASVIGIFLLLLVIVFSRMIFRKIATQDKKIYVFGLLFFIISLLPFLGLGNMSSRYAYVASIGILFLFVLFMKRLYAVLSTNGSTIAKAGVALVVSTYCLYQIVQIQKIQSDWFEAGEKSRRFIVAMQSAYEDYWASEPIELHLINVPIRNGEAWVFPVGISDAMWMLFRNPHMSVYSWPSYSAALHAVGYTTRTKKIFEFTQDGKIIEKTYTHKSQ
ncbi:hypothetical protein HY086_02300 [Candidatus Gottesmanbacteria bacterium]|nr:hypothetical protein [Candidatus Gottesmanbacteria bacterium]